MLAGLGLGSFLILSGSLISNGKNFEGHVLGVLTCAAGSGAMAGRVVKSKKFMPAGIVALGLTASGIYNLVKMNEWKPANPQPEPEQQK